MNRKPKKIYTATKGDNTIIKEWIDQANEDDSELKLAILKFYFDWIFKHNRKVDSIYHNSIYRILKAIGISPKTDK